MDFPGLDLSHSIDVISDMNGMVPVPLFVASSSASMCAVMASLVSDAAVFKAIEIDVDPSLPPPFPPPPSVLAVADMWWAGMNENGWGLSIDQHDEKLFTVIYAYDAIGAPTWFVIPSGTWDAQKRIYSGSVYHPHALPYYGYDASKFAPGDPVGVASLSFSDANHATLSYKIDGVSGSKAIGRQGFGAVAPFTSGLGDLWWGGGAQNGWGISVAQQYASLFNVWYTYDANGNPTWFVMPAGTWTDANTYEGRMYRTIGSPWLGQAYDPSKLQVFDVGSFKIRFIIDNASFDYAVDGHTGTLLLDRQGF